ncbi:M1 family metallopeptidase [Hymenobacter busanensis]|uniref:M1 family metallopeptidase n=1 Tax=Hymenobacter busanensis TaxID=2607656 RepID=A0A7L4ZV75_9BACT|nr:M1 family metallopeptidase [Hymenobacter busanensis]KAA9339376.1 M1 family metallopeptidase [Hymenobacter busanensis]QHJ06863.1 peptidase [Hymenobacter busanensis]
MNCSYLAASLLSLLTLPSFAQQPAPLPVPRNLQATYAKGTRAASGQPGPNYWQNAADYVLKVNFDPTTRRVQGTVDIAYRNNSPDALPQLWFKLYANYYQQGAPRASRIKPEDVGEGVRIEQLRVNGQVIEADKFGIEATNMVVPLAQPIAAKGTAQVSVSYSYTLNQGSHMRTGEIEPGADFVAYFFPRIAVYDDIDGWNKFAYNGSQEFYNDFANFSADITVPKDFVVWATGDLTNADQVLTKKYVKRLRDAEKKDGIVNVIETADLQRRDITAANAQNTWHFEARNVTDFAFATADHYVWQATSLVVDPATKRRTRVDAVYNTQHQDYAEVVHFARKTVEAMSYTFPKWPFPYPHITVFDGLDQMEYPMMVNDNPVSSREDAITLTDHEVFHTMFPFYLGTNETKYGWMDEGWATIGEWLISSIIDPKLDDNYGVAPYAQLAATEIDVPITTLSTQQTDRAFFLNSYPKPAFGYLYVKDLLGDELFTKALHHYISTWQGKHPMPFDFFNSMNAGAGHNLNWFWQRWFFDDGYPDLAIQSVTKDGAGYSVVVQAKGSKPVPVDLTITYADNTTEKIHRSVGVWESGATAVTVPVATAKALKQVKLGSTLVPDSYPQDNVWTGQ